MGQELHMFFFPLMAYGHMIPTIDMAKLFASRGVTTTIITTTFNAPFVSKSIQNTQKSGFKISIKIFEFPVVEAGCPPGCENLDHILSDEMIPKFFQACAMLRGPLEHAIRELRPDCLVADMFFPWTHEVAAEFGIPRLVFHGSSFFFLCASEHLRLYKPYKGISSDSQPILLPYLPDEVMFTKKELPDFMQREVETEFSKTIDEVRESESKSYGVIVNSFYGLEPAYADHYRKVLGTKAWHIGPVSLCNREMEDKVNRGKLEPSVDKLECLKWLDSKRPNSVIYVCFGSTASFSDTQLCEIAMGLEASEQEFIWVVRKPVKTDQEKGIDYEDEDKTWLPEGFKERTEGKGLIIRGWAPQVLILDHKAVGGFVTHCGWNSILEGVSAGVPMVTWPVFGDQFLNQKLVTEILKTGVACQGLGREAVEEAVRGVMQVGEEEADARRSRVIRLKDMARKAVENGGSSHSDLNALIEELISLQVFRNKVVVQ